MIKYNLQISNIDTAIRKKRISSINNQHWHTALAAALTAHGSNTSLFPLQVTPAVIFGCQGPRTWGLGRWPSISEPRVLWKKEELREESLTTGLCSLCCDPGSQATIRPHLELCYHLCDEGAGLPPYAFRPSSVTLFKAWELGSCSNTSLSVCPALWIQLYPLIRFDNVDRSILIELDQKEERLNTYCTPGEPPGEL